MNYSKYTLIFEQIENKTINIYSGNHLKMIYLKILPRKTFLDIDVSKKYYLSNIPISGLYCNNIISKVIEKFIINLGGKIIIYH